MRKQGPIVHKDRQRGAVMIMFALLIVLLFGVMALVIDLGRTYVVRTELQNAADAAALAGAKDLNQTAAGVTTAVATAVAMAAQNTFKFTSVVSISAANISVGGCPEDGCMVLASAIGNDDALAAGKTFLKVDIPSGPLNTFFAQVLGIASTQTFGRAVAGHFVTEITPIGVCAIDAATPGGRRIATGLEDELTEYGFRRGVSYNLMQLGDVAGTSTPYLLNPVDAYAAGGPCSNNNSSANVAAPFICNGTSTVVVKAPGFTYGSTGLEAGPVERALNARFDDFQGNTCNPSNAPPDVNVKEYTVPSGGGAGPNGNPRDWSQAGGNTLPSQQSITIDANTHKPVAALGVNDYGMLWSYSRAVKASGASPNAVAVTGANAFFGLSDWSSLYAGNTADTSANGYPSDPASPPFPTGTLAAPYNAANGNKYFAAPSHAAKRERRVIQIAIVDCANSSGNNCNATIKILGIGRFFMTRRANLPARLDAEFDGLLNPVPPTEIRLYK